MFDHAVCKQEVEITLAGHCCLLEWTHETLSVGLAIYTISKVYIRHSWQGNHQIYGHIQCKYTVLANPNYFILLFRQEVETSLQGTDAHLIQRNLPQMSEVIVCPQSSLSRREVEAVAGKLAALSDNRGCNDGSTKQKACLAGHTETEDEEAEDGVEELQERGVYVCIYVCVCMCVCVCVYA
jgi:hypothetical protein